MNNPIIQHAINVMRTLERKIIFFLNSKYKFEKKRDEERYQLENLIEKYYRLKKSALIIKAKYDLYLKIHSLLHDKLDIIELNSIYLNNKLSFIRDGYLTPINNEYEKIKYDLIDHKNRVVIQRFTTKELYIPTIITRESFRDRDKLHLAALLHECIINCKGYRQIIIHQHYDYNNALKIYSLSKNYPNYTPSIYEIAESLYEKQMRYTLNNSTIFSLFLIISCEQDKKVIELYNKWYFHYYDTIDHNITPKEEKLFLESHKIIKGSMKRFI